MSKAEKATYDVISLCKFMGKFMFIIALSIALCVLSDVLINQILFNVGTTLLAVSVIFVVIYANTGNRFEIKKLYVSSS